MIVELAEITTGNISSVRIGRLFEPQCQRYSKCQYYTTYDDHGHE